MSGISSNLSRLLLSAYYCSSLPWRWCRNAMAANAGRAPVMILFYHRIADHGANGWSMPFATFAHQMRWLRHNFDLVSLEEAQRRVAIGKNDRSAVAVTFDDGYAENCERALPLLLEQRIPVTYFVASQHILEGRPFPHDVADGRPLPANTVDQLRELIDAGVEIGAHTRTHPDLGAIQDPAILFDEMAVCRNELEDALQCPIRYFSFPYGLHQNLSGPAFAMAREIGFAAVCSAYGGYNFPGDDAFHLQRIHADPDIIRLKNWLTVDPRKLAMVRRFVADERQDVSQPVGAL
ncbi:MAG: polysaccharide deacetylase family protein [Pirellulaceae bacterium]|nr:polysaccharide deacetylase family protein [Pirellulaceae bacterium]MDP7305840.1 polysaccharide deacetylase family protein [Pirellulaceae bacterium]HJN07239.1 polysaccharide deacetylase family protein [Pirellulaceae bacterium]